MTRKHAFTGEYLDICNECFREIEEFCPVPVIDRKDLMTEIDVDEELEEIEEQGVDKDTDLW
jgi:hypothetical protein